MSEIEDLIESVTREDEDRLDRLRTSLRQALEYCAKQDIPTPTSIREEGEIVTLRFSIGSEEAAVNLRLHLDNNTASIYIRNATIHIQMEGRCRPLAFIVLREYLMSVGVPLPSQKVAQPKPAGEIIPPASLDL